MFRYPRFWTVAGIVLLALIAAWDAPAPFRLPAAAGSPGSVNLSAQAACPAVSGTPYLTIVYGSVQLDGTGAPVGTIVEAVSPRDDVVGCFVVHTAGYYGTMYVYGEDPTANPPIPGMRDGETVTFRVAGVVATASPSLVWHNDWTFHQVDLAATSPPPPVAPVVSISRDGNNIVLSWPHLAQNASYQIWRDTIPYFTPGESGTNIAGGMPPAPNCTYAGETITCTDPAVLGDPAVNYFYLVHAFNAAGAEADSNRVGEFDFAVIPGN
jgi:hypothetical protein